MLFCSYRVLKVIPNYWTEEDAPVPSEVGKVKNISLILEGKYKQRNYHTPIVVRAKIRDRI
jgi:hypothetical protein